MFASSMKLVVVCLLMALSGGASADLALNMPQGVTEVSRGVYNLHMIILWICVVIGIGVFAAMFYSIYAHRKSKGAKAAQFHESTTVEVIWTVVPFLILVGMAIPSTMTLMEMYDTTDPDMTVKVTGYQWKWHYDYLDEGFGFFSTLDSRSNEARQVGSDIAPESVPNYLLNVDNPLVLPAGKKVRFVITANDVIHAWWVPEFGWKKDAIPGFINEAWTRIDAPGIYRGQCAELCGRDHGFMPIVVEVKSEADYAKWVEERKVALTSMSQVASAQ
jgi:cytochrome c oxidase subunit 2